MTTLSTTPPEPREGLLADTPRPRRSRRPDGAGAPRWVEAPPFEKWLSLVLTMASVTIIALLVNVTFISQVQHYASQAALYEQIRLSLAQGAAPTGPLNSDGTLVTPGTPIAVLSAPDIGIGHEVVVEGTASAQTMVGIGHRRDTALPCQLGTAVLMARAGAYGGVGQSFKNLAVGSTFTVSMGQGTCTYEVTGSRMPGDQAPPAPVGTEGRLTLTTASGYPFFPTEVYRVDARLVGDGLGRPAVGLPTGALPTSEAAMGVDTSNLFGLVLLLQLLVGLAIGTTLLWKRWGRWQAWIICGPAVLAVGILAAGAVNQWLLPNLL
ncbi:sortase [Herbiconiux sp. P18]|uniref:sortase n=1 Tax=Herbiconiux liangxiaofengii TaxID=3342795 RepID=UPI003CE797A7